jgi:hypothetical protein
MVDMVDDMLHLTVRAVFAAGAFAVMLMAHILGLHTHDDWPAGSSVG